MLVVAEVLASSHLFGGREHRRVAVHPLLRLAREPRRLGTLGLAPELLLLGHGDPIARDASDQIAEAVRTARRAAPAMLLGLPRAILRARSAERTLGC